MSTTPRSGGRRAGPRPRNTAAALGAAPTGPPAAAFADLDLPAELLAELDRQGVAVPFPIQAATLPDSLAGRDVLGCGRTGSGKTLAFGLPVLARTGAEQAEPRSPSALILVPTRELAQQVGEALAPYARAARLRTAAVFGGVSINRQADALRRADVVVATPGRLSDLIERGSCRLDRVRTTVLDEADQMADMGFLPQVTALLRQVPAGGQRLLFSATLDGGVDRLVRAFLTDPVLHSVDPPVAAVTTLEHHLLHVTEDDKPQTLAHVAARDGRVLLFVDTKRGADRMARRLLAAGVRAAALHGGKTQPQRDRTLARFRSGQVTALVATNVAARGIHVDDLDLVLNTDPPSEAKDYLHRGGRTARAGASGRVVTLVLPHQQNDARRLMAAAGVVPRVTAVRPGDEELTRITGARPPSGVPVEAPAPPAPASASRKSGRSGGAASRRRSRPVSDAGTDPAPDNGGSGAPAVRAPRTGRKARSRRRGR